MLTVVEPFAASDHSAPDDLDGDVVRTTTLRRVPSLRAQVLVALVIVLGRFLFAAHVTTFRISPDEIANGGMSRVLAGGQFNMLRAGTWQPGLSTLLAPLTAAVDDPETWIRLALVANGLVAGASVFVLVPLSLRLTTLGPRAVLLLSAVVMLSPASLYASAHVWAEPLVTLTFLGATFTTLKFYDLRSGWLGLLAICVASIGLASHGRLLVLFVAVVVVVVGGLLSGRQWWVATGCSLAAAASYLGVSAYSSWVFARAWEDPSSERSVTAVLRRVLQPLDVLDAFAGQTWYLLVTTLFIAPVGFAVLVASARRNTGSRDARLLLALTVPLIGLSVLFMSDRSRPDYLVYGRYNDAVIWPVLIVGLGWIAQTWPSMNWRRRLPFVLGLPLIALELGFLLEQLHGKELESGQAVVDMIAGLSPTMSVGGRLDVIMATVLAVVGFVVLLVALVVSERSRALGLSLGLAILMVGSARSHDLFRANGEVGNWGDARLGAVWIDENVPDDEVIGVLLMPDAYEPSAPVHVITTYALLYQWYGPERRFVIDDGPEDEVGPYVLAPSNDIIMNLGGATMLWQQPDTGVALWLENRIAVESGKSELLS